MRTIVRTSDRGQFKRCRELWNFTSKVRLNYEYAPGIVYLDAGTAWHAGMEILFDPKRVNDPLELVVAEAKAAIKRHMLDWKRRLMATDQFELNREDYEEHVVLLPKMLDHFISWLETNPLGFKPVLSEIEFEVPIPVPYDHELPSGFYRAPVDGYGMEEYLHVWDSEEPFGLVPVWYQGRIDCVGEQEDGKLVIVDWKTAGQFSSDTTHLELDPQMKSYAWAARRMLGLDIDGILYFEFRKKVPEPPAQLKNGGLSRNKSQATTVEMYKAEIERLGLNLADYEDFLPVLAANQQEYFRPTPVYYSQAELEMEERHILDEAIDMFNNPRIYPTPSRLNCQGCKFRTPCLMKQDQSDWRWYLEHSGLYIKRA